MSIHFSYALIIIFLVTMLTPSQTRAQNVSQLSQCPNSPNCVSSKASPSDTGHFIEPFTLKMNASTAWPFILKVLQEQPRTQIKEVTNDLIQAEVTSLIFRFTDDITLLLNEKNQTIDVRSASRVGYSDLGVNRKRIATLRKILQQAQVIK